MLAKTSSTPLQQPFTYAQARAAGLSKYRFYQLRDRGEIEQLGHGLYRRAADELPDLELLELAIRAPRATLCLTTALVRHGLSDAIPTAADVALPRGTRAPVTTAPVEWHSFEVATFDVGRGVLRLNKAREIGLYSAERSIIDAFRLRGREGSELGLDALKRWLRQAGNQPAGLLHLARQFPRSTKAIQHALEVLL